MKRVLVFGVGCKKERNLVNEIQRIAKENNIGINIEYENSIDEMIRLKIKKTPSFMIDNKIYYDTSCCSLRND